MVSVIYVSSAKNLRFLSSASGENSCRPCHTSVSKKSWDDGKNGQGVIVILAGFGETVVRGLKLFLE